MFFSGDESFERVEADVSVGERGVENILASAGILGGDGTTSAKQNLDQAAVARRGSGVEDAFREGDCERIPRIR